MRAADLMRPLLHLSASQPARHVLATHSVCRSSSNFVSRGISRDAVGY